VDEIHAMVDDKRGSHLALSIERLQALVASRYAALRAATGDAEVSRYAALRAATGDAEASGYAALRAATGDTEASRYAALRAATEAGKMPAYLEPLVRIGLSATQKP